jgi:hypothetical protein
MERQRARAAQAHGWEERQSRHLITMQCETTIRKHAYRDLCCYAGYRIRILFHCGGLDMPPSLFNGCNDENSRRTDKKVQAI